MMTLLKALSHVVSWYLIVQGGIVLGFILLPVDAVSSTDRFEPLGLNLTFQQDPTTTITIDWHVDDAESATLLELRAQGERETWQQFSPEETVDFPFSSRFIHRREVTGLEPNTMYEFRFGEGSKEYTFRTLPADNERHAVRLAIGGDVRHEREMMERTGRVAMAYDPHMIVFGGDLAYGDGDPRLVHRWYEWFEVTRDVFRASDGRIVPVVVGIGNHEIWLGDKLEKDAQRLADEWGLEVGDAPYFMTLFPQPSGTSYRVLDVGDYLSLVLLDTGHYESVEGAQATWLEAVLVERQSVSHVFPVYHVPAYPSVRSVDGTTSTKVREAWVPLFEAHGVRTAFEMHDHAYKRTVPIREGVRHPDGVVYIGDGAWGVYTRPVGRDHATSAWYLKRGASERHVILTTIRGSDARHLVANEDGEVIDAYPEEYLQEAEYDEKVSVNPAPVILGRPKLQSLPRRSIEVAPALLSDYTGHYRIEGSDTLDVHISQHSGGALTLGVPELGYSDLVLFPQSETHFFIQRLDAEFTFLRNAAGAVTGVEIRHDGGLATAKRVDE